VAESSSGGSNVPTTATATPAQTAPVQAASSLPSWLTADIVGIPVWGWAAGAIVLLMIIPRGR